MNHREHIAKEEEEKNEIFKIEHNSPTITIWNLSEYTEKS